jgi:hypothetical protein
MAFLAPKSFPRVSAASQFGTFADTVIKTRWSGGCVMMTLDAYIRQENISLYKKLLADRNISDGQRDVIRKMLADEEARFLNSSPQEPNG